MVSPHFDDGALSTGGLVAQLARNGAVVMVATIFSALPKQPLSPAAQAFHDQCGLGDDAMLQRAIEDCAASRCLGVRSIHLGMEEALYRRDKCGASQYTEGSSIFEAEIAAEAGVVDQVGGVIGALIEEFDPTLVLAPLGVGAHIDHVITHHAVNRVTLDNDRLLWFEDLPYALYKHLRGWEQDCTTDLVAELVEIDELAWQSKVNAIASYQSQLSVLWYEQTVPWEIQMRRYAETLGGGKLVERLWRPR